MKLSAKLVAATAEIKLLTVGEIKTAQDGIKSSLTKLDGAVHANFIQCLLHAEQHGDTSLMVRLLVHTIDAKSGYRRQGLINAMRKFSPMELTKDTINLSGILDEPGAKALVKQFPEDLTLDALEIGERRPFLVALADRTPFWTDMDNAERIVKPVWRDNVIGKIAAGSKEFRSAWANTQDGKAVDESKPFFDGPNGEAVLAFFDEVDNKVAELPKDNTRVIRTAETALAKAQADMADAEQKVA